MIKVKVDLSRLKPALEANTRKELRRVTEEAVEALAAATPVDTGAAAHGWEATHYDGHSEITNPQDYVKYLNAGSSEQAPSNFIEATLLSYGYSNGPVVTYDE